MIPSFADHFSGHAADYAQFRPAYPETLARYLSDRAPSRTRAWECGCGNGQLSGQLAAYFTEIMATDASTAQIARAPQQPGVVFQVGQAEASGLTGHSVSLIVAAQAAHWFDLPAFYAEVERVACPGGVLALVCYGLNQVTPEIDRLVRAFYHDPLGPYWPAERRHVEARYKTLAFPYPELQAPAFRMQTQWDYAQFVGYIETWSAFRRWRAEAGSAQMSAYHAFQRALSTAWGPATCGRRIQWPLSLRLGRVMAPNS